MKKIVNGNELREKMKKAIDLLCGTVKMTLGPKGNNIIIDHSTFSPFITNDGVTIAENIESDDPVINTILELAKEASVKTNEVSGDGTTTTLVLLESIFNEGLNKIEDGINPLILKRELDISLNNIISMINDKSRKIRVKELKYIASASANDENIGDLVSDVFKRVKNKSAINVKENDQENIIVEYNKGYIFETLLASPYFLKKSEISFNNPYLLLVNNYLDSIDEVADILNYVMLKKKHLVIIAKDYCDDFVNRIVSMFLDNHISIVLLKVPMYGTKQIDFYDDLNAIIENKIVIDEKKIDTTNLYEVVNIKINNEKTIINFKENSFIEEHVKILKSNLKSSDEKDYLKEKIAMFETGTAEIIVGAPTKLERREKKMRIDDAICAVDSCKNGVVLGCGLTFLQISDELSKITVGDEILVHALKKPIEQIFMNAALDLSIIDKLKKDNFNKIYNINTAYYEDIKNTKVLDPTNVVCNALKNAVSIAGMLLTTSSLVINERKNEFNKINEYGEL